MSRGRTPWAIHTGLAQGPRRAALGALLVSASLLAAPAAMATTPLAVQAACPSPGPGQTSCLAQLVVNANTDQPVHSDGGTVPPGTAAPQAGTPAYLQEAYDVSGLAATAGTGDIVAVIDAFGDSHAESDLAQYRATYGLPACTTANGCFKKVDENGGTNYPANPTGGNSGWITETSLDMEAVSALCPNCSILVVQAASSGGSDMLAAEAEAAKLGAKQISNSWGGSEYSGESSLQSDFGFSGVAVVASAGDNGYGDTEWPAALPNVTAAGGTSLTTADTPRGFSESAWSGSGSGCSPYIAKPGWQTDTGCSMRTISDVSADADPETGLLGYDSMDGSFLAGGTSLSSPLVAAYYALVGGGAGVGSAAWDYARAAELNDPSGGATGSCSSAYLCQGVVGYDGPTGIGSISGDPVASTPGVGGAYVASTTDTTATLDGGAFPNQLDTTVSWQYGPTNTYGSSTAPVDLGSAAGAQSASATLTGVVASTTYHFRLVAQNADGTSYGSDGTLTTGASGTGLGGSGTVSGSGSGTGVTTGSGSAPGGSGSGSGSSSSGGSGSDPGSVGVVDPGPVGQVSSGGGAPTNTGSSSGSASGSLPARPTGSHPKTLPVLKLTIGSRNARVLLNCAQRCSGTLVLRSSSGTVLGRATVHLLGRGWVTLKLNSGAHRALARTTRVRTVTVQLVARGGGTPTESAVVRI